MAVGKYLELAVILKAFDQMSGTVKNALGNAEAGYKSLANSHERAQEHMQKGLTMGAGAFVAIDALKSLADKYGDVDAAQRQLRISEMKPGGVIDNEAFERQMTLVKALSAAYGEHQTSYIDMIRVMKNYHLDDKDILGGTGKSVALLSKLFQSSPDAGALFASRMKTDFRVNPDEMGKMVDMAIRLKQLNSGLSGEEMLHNLTEFSAGIALSSQNLGMKGAKDASELQVLGAMYTAKGIPAEQVATTLRRIFENITKPDRLKKMDEAAAKYGRHLHFFDRKGNFEGIDNFVAQLGTLKNLKPSAVTEILGVLGSAQGMSSVMLKNIAKFGTDDFLDFNNNYANQGTPEQKLNEMMGGQTEQLKKAAVDLENLEVVLGQGYNPAVKEGANLSQKFFGFITDFASNHGIITGVAEAVVGLGGALMIAGSAFHFASAAWNLWGAGSIFRWIAGSDIWSGITMGAESFAMSLLKIPSLIGEIGTALTELGVVGSLGLGAIIAEMAYFPYKMFTEHQKDVEASAEYLADLAAHPYEHKFTALSQADIDDFNKHKKNASVKKSEFEYHSPFQNRPDITNDLKNDLGRGKSLVTDHQKPTIVYSPTININGNTPVTKKSIADTLSEHGNKLLELINKNHNDHLRTSFSH